MRHYRIWLLMAVALAALAGGWSVRGAQAVTSPVVVFVPTTAGQNAQAHAPLDTHVSLAAGEAASITATGNASVCTSCPKNEPPGGVGASCNGNPACTAPALPAYSLIGSFGASGPWFEVGAGPTIVHGPNGGGELFLAFNDGIYNDNDPHSGFTATITRDTTPPVITYANNHGVYTIADAVHISCTVTDPPPSSAIVFTTCHDISGPAFSFGVGTHNFSSVATDAAGNTGHGSTSFTVVDTLDSLCSLTEQFLTGDRNPQRFCVPLNSAAASGQRGQPSLVNQYLDQYIGMVQAATPSEFSNAQAQLLTEFAILRKR